MWRMSITRRIRLFEDIPMPAVTLTVNHPAGLHARPAAAFVKTAAAFPCRITVRNVHDDTPPVNAKSILSVLTLGVHQGYEIEVESQGEQAQEALDAIVNLIESNFGESE